MHLNVQLLKIEEHLGLENKETSRVSH